MVGRAEWIGIVWPSDDPFNVQFLFFQLRLQPLILDDQHCLSVLGGTQSLA
jgi:hypothetical protein